MQKSTTKDSGVFVLFGFAQGKSLAPQDPDWIYKRAAAILRHLYLRPNCGVGAFRKFFSCKTGKKCIPGHTSKVRHSVDGCGRWWRLYIVWRLGATALIVHPWLVCMLFCSALAFCSSVCVCAGELEDYPLHSSAVRGNGSCGVPPRQVSGTTTWCSQPYLLLL